MLDIGGGTGRNTLALARRGHPVDVVEMTPKFADTIRGRRSGVTQCARDPA
jgi:16S rRNA A1518/A1519 N6-dimethyltransferase RsmA/KsgA/DIM1 with predicted DNA glycosylase/AP lyase activity